MNGMANSMRKWGAIDKECPECHQLTPIYPTTVKGGNKSVGCVHCGASLQLDNGKAVLATYGTLSEEEERILDEKELDTIALVAKTSFGVRESKLHPSLKGRHPDPKLSLFQRLMDWLLKE